MRPHSGNAARRSAHRPRSQAEPIRLPAAARGVPADCRHLSAEFHAGLKHSESNLLGGRDVTTGSPTIASWAEVLPPTHPKRDPLEKRWPYLSPPVLVLWLQAGLWPQHIPEDTRGQRHPGIKHSACKAAPEPLAPRRERFRGAVGCRGTSSRRAPSVPAPHLAPH